MKKSKRKLKRHEAPAVDQPATAERRDYRVMTVALIREPQEVEAVEVAFSESARFYRLPRVNPHFEAILSTLREARQKKRPVRVLMESPQSNVIVDAASGG